MIRWWNDPKFPPKEHQAIIYVTDNKYGVSYLPTPIYTLHTVNDVWDKFPIIGPNEMSRWENDDEN